MCAFDADLISINATVAHTLPIVQLDEFVVGEHRLTLLLKLYIEIEWSSVASLWSLIGTDDEPIDNNKFGLQFEDNRILTLWTRPYLCWNRKNERKITTL